MPPPQQDKLVTRVSGNFYNTCVAGQAARLAFTLAEVLITLGVIGIVAALTMPTLIQNHKKKQTISQLKTAYSILSQATSLAKIEHGDISSWDFELNNIDFANKYVLPYLKVGKTISTLQDKSYWRLDSLGGSIFISWPWEGGQGSNVTKNPIYILSNGSAITVAHFLDLSMRITVDINGAKGPNTMGIDGFCFHFNKNTNRLDPERYNYSRSYMLDSKNGYACSREKGSPYYAGTQCAAVIIMDGWKISDDYPWGNGGKTPIPKD